MSFVEATTVESSYDRALQDEVALTSFITIVIPIVYGIVCVVGLIGNVLVIYVMSTLHSSIRISDIFLINLAVADLLFVCSLPFWAIKFALYHAWIFGDELCRIISWFSLLGRYATTYFIATMAIDRLAAVIFHTQTKQYRTKTVSYIVSAALWVFATAISTPALVFRMTVQDQTDPNSSLNPEYCRWFFNNQTSSDYSWYYIHLIGFKFFIGFMLPLLIITTCYVAIIVYIKRRKSQKQKLRNKQNKITVTITVVVIVFVLCWLPNEITASIYTAQAIGIMSQPLTPNNIQDHILVVSNFLIWCHSCVNPFLYAFMRDDVKKKLSKMMRSLKSTCFKSGSIGQGKNNNVQLRLIQNNNENSYDEESPSKFPVYHRKKSNSYFKSKRSRSTLVSALQSTEVNVKKKRKAPFVRIGNAKNLEEDKKALQL